MFIDIILLPGKYFTRINNYMELALVLFSTFFPPIFLASLPNLSQLIGSLVAGYVANRFGRRKAMLLFCIPLLSGWVTIIFSRGNSKTIMLGRILKVFEMFIISLEY